MPEPFHSKWLDWTPEKKKSVDTPTLETDKTDEFESVSFVSSKPGGFGEKKTGPTDYETLARSGLVARIRTAWPWLAEHRPDLFRAVRDADEAGDVERLHRAMEEASRAFERRPANANAVRIFSRMLEAEVWLAATEDDAAEFHRAGTGLVVLLPGEAETLAGMAEADARVLLEALAKIQRAFPGARLRDGSVVAGPHLDDAPGPVDDPPAEWSPETAELIQWFQAEHAAATLPTEPFALTPWMQIADPARWYASLEADIAAGPRGARGRSGALLADLANLRAGMEER